VFVTLKLCKVIDWSWWWVTAPFWGIPALALFVLLISVIGLGIIGLIEFFDHKRRQRNGR
jgi:membrane protein YdbS with pleckstrin-like domain